MIKIMARWCKGIKNYLRQKIKEDGVLYTGVFWFLVVLTLVSVLGLLIAMFSSGSGWFLYKLIGTNTKLQLIQTLGSGILGCLAILGVTIANRRVKAANETAKAANRTAANQVKATENQIAVTKEANIEKAFATAIAHLGSGASSVRLGSIYSLYGIAKEYEERRENISAILCMHLREKTKESQYQQDYKNKPSSEIQYLLNILTQLDKEGNFIWDGIVKDFSGAYLTGVKLNFSSLKKARLEEAQLQGAHLGGAQLQGAHLEDAQLQGARLWRTQLQRANLRDAQLQRARLRETQLQGAYLWGAQLQGAYLSEAQLQGAHLRDAQLQGAYLVGVQLQGADLDQVQLQGADLDQVQLQGAYLRGAQLQGAYLRGAQLQGTYLSKAQLQGAHLRDAQLQGATLSYAQLQGVIASEKRRAFRMARGRGFEERINNCKNKNSDLKEVVFSGGIYAQKAQKIINSFQSLYKESWIAKKRYEKMKEIIEQHKGEEENYEVIPDPPEYENLKERYHCETGVLTEEEADRIIAEYKKAMKKAGVKE